MTNVGVLSTVSFYCDRYHYYSIIVLNCEYLWALNLFFYSPLIFWKYVSNLCKYGKVLCLNGEKALWYKDINIKRLVLLNATYMLFFTLSGAISTKPVSLLNYSVLPISDFDFSYPWLNLPMPEHIRSKTAFFSWWVGSYFISVTSKLKVNDRENIPGCRGLLRTCDQMASQATSVFEAESRAPGSPYRRPSETPCLPLRRIQVAGNLELWTTPSHPAWHQGKGPARGSEDPGPRVSSAAGALTDSTFWVLAHKGGARYSSQQEYSASM